MLARHLLPGGFAELVPEADRAIGRGVGQENAPAILRHLDRAVARPTLGVDRRRRAQVDFGGTEIRRTHLAPPVQELRLPLLQRTLQRAVLAESDVVRDALEVVDRHAQTLSRLNGGLVPVPNSLSAPLSPTAFGRLKIQFCQAESRAKILLCAVSGPTKRKFASSPVSASGDRLAR